MKWPTLLVLAAGLLAAASAPQQDEVKKEMEKFQGTWKTVSVERDGEPVVPEEELKDLKLYITGDKRVLKVREAVRSQGTYKLDPTKSPKAIDITVSEGPLQGQTVYGIYEIDGDTQKICLTLEGKERPKEFKSTPGSGHLLQVFQREKK
jgi:RNA polymerase sigma-70 factor (ECF subfamily)